MRDCIYRDAAIKLFNFAVLDCLGMEPTIRAGDIIKALQSIPAADVRPVVLCKDCMYCQKDELGRWCFNDYENELRDEDFCSHGKRKESKT